MIKAGHLKFVVGGKGDVVSDTRVFDFGTTFFESNITSCGLVEWPLFEYLKLELTT